MKAIDLFAGGGGFTEGGYIWPKSAVATKMMLGNAVPPVLAKVVTDEMLKRVYAS